MYSRQEAAQIKQAFWTSFGSYMAPVPSADGEKLNWINYKTGEKHLYFKMNADNKEASIGIFLTHPDQGVRDLYYEQLVELKFLLEATIGEPWIWQQRFYDDQGKEASRIFTNVSGKSIMKQEHWPALISFFKPRIIALDAFWSNVKHLFEALR